ncbi:unnamed protein product, partial [Hapterophycus canaliculatus]
PGLSAFTSGDAHNGCRALFNGTAGWAYIGPAGMIDPKALPPGTVSYSYDSKSRSRGLFAGGRRGSQSQRDGTYGGNASGGGGGGGGHATKKPGEGLGRKLNDARMAYLDADDLRHLVHEAGELRLVGDGGGSGYAHGSGHCEDDEEGGGEGGEGRPTRKGRPIVLTLQAIFAATSPTSPSAAALAAATAPWAAAAGTDDGSDSDPFSASSASPADVSATAAAAPPVPVAVADHTQFPPLMLRGSSAEKGPGLFLAPPITMVKNETTTTTANPTDELLEEDSTGAQGGLAEMSGGNGGNDRGKCSGVSCSEVVAATSVAEGQSAGGGEVEKGGTAGDPWLTAAVASCPATCGATGGRAADRGKSMMEDEDPYYARKRVGAFAFKTKPRGKAHK